MDNNIPDRSWFSKFISLNEEKTSTIVISYLCFCGIAIYMLFKKGEIPQNLTTLLTIQSGGILGVNCFNYVSNNMSMSKSQNGMMPMQNQYGYSNSYSPYGNSSMGMGMNTMGMNSINTMPMNNSIMPNSTLNPTGQPISTTPITTSTMQNMQRPI